MDDLKARAEDVVREAAFEHTPPAVPREWLEDCMAMARNALFMQNPSRDVMDAVQQALEGGFRKGWRAATHAHIKAIREATNES